MLTITPLMRFYRTNIFFKWLEINIFVQRAVFVLYVQKIVIQIYVLLCWYKGGNMAI
jgi:hypothetical protein